MKILCWNVRGLGNQQMFRVLHSHVRESRPDLMFLMKTLTDHVVLKKIHIHFGFIGKLVVDRIGRCGSLYLLWNASSDVNLLSYSEFHIDDRVTSHEQKFGALRVYMAILRHRKRPILGLFYDVSTVSLICLG
ncbi:hypothetical protein ACOSQ3_014526 [Xanthoceras sorbifolium]